jgi:hypothetical protein
LLPGAKRPRLSRPALSAETPSARTVEFGLSLASGPDECGRFMEARWGLEDGWAQRGPLPSSMNRRPYLWREQLLCPMCGGCGFLLVTGDGPKTKPCRYQPFAIGVAAGSPAAPWMANWITGRTSTVAELSTDASEEANYAVSDIIKGSWVNRPHFSPFFHFPRVPDLHLRPLFGRLMDPYQTVFRQGPLFRWAIWVNEAS